VCCYKQMAALNDRMVQVARCKSREEKDALLNIELYELLREGMTGSLPAGLNTCGGERGGKKEAEAGTRRDSHTEGQGTRSDLVHAREWMQSIVLWELAEGAVGQGGGDMDGVATADPHTFAAAARSQGLWLLESCKSRAMSTAHAPKRVAGAGSRPKTQSAQTRARSTSVATSAAGGASGRSKSAVVPDHQISGGGVHLLLDARCIYFDSLHVEGWAVCTGRSLMGTLQRASACRHPDAQS